jgi:hypothetical protein
MKPPTTQQILKALKDWKQTLIDSVQVGGIVSDKKTQREIACIDAAACHVIASSKNAVGSRSTRDPLVQPSDWISARKERPDTDIIVLIHTADPQFSEPVWVGYYDSGDASGPPTWRNVDGQRVTHVTHWRHLPEPPTNLQS